VTQANKRYTLDQEVQEAIKSISSGRTVLLVAHRLSTVCTADKIAVLNNGSLSEEGSHDFLSKAGGAYAALWEAQSKRT
jgi:ABC-type transport system involved in Fe-S cluster assembly fused permease/ATPase subunit